MSPSPQTTYAPSACSQGMHQIPVQSRTEGFSSASQTYPRNLSHYSYVVPWAQPQSMSQFQPQPQQHPSQPPSPLSSRHTHHESEQQHHQPARQEQLQPQPLPQTQRVLEQHQHHQYSSHQQHLQPNEPQSQPQPQPCTQSQTVHGHQPQPQQQFQNPHLQYPSRYPPPPWAATPGYGNCQSHSPATNVISTRASITVSYPSPGVRPVLNNNSFTARGSIGGSPASATGQNHFVPSYRLFEDLSVFGNTDGKVKMTSSGSSSSSSGAMGPGMVGGRK